VCGINSIYAPSVRAGPLPADASMLLAGRNAG
jgi:hypothetical protein